MKHEIEVKLRNVRAELTRVGVDGVRFKGVDWFAWITGGADSSVIFSAEKGVAEVLVTHDLAIVLTNTIEHTRLLEEQISGLQIQSYPWADSEAIAASVKKLAPTVCSDRPSDGELPLDVPWHALKWTLSDEELLRYHALGKDAAEAVTEALTRCNPRQTEIELAGIAAQALWKRGIHPLLTMVGGERRVNVFRHPVASDTLLETHAMLVVCGRRHGLFANLTRHVFFREPTEKEKQLAQDVAEIEAEAFTSTEQKLSLPETYEQLRKSYEYRGYEKEILLHHQGGPCGYLSREAIATPHAAPNLQDIPAPAFCRAFAWNPSISGGAKIEDTIFLNEYGKLEILTVDPRFPTETIRGRTRPSFLRLD